MTGVSEEDLKKIVKQIIAWVENGDAEVAAKFMLHLKAEYVELATLATNGAYRSSWTHKEIMDFVTNS